MVHKATNRNERNNDNNIFKNGSWWKIRICKNNEHKKQLMKTMLTKQKFSTIIMIWYNYISNWIKTGQGRRKLRHITTAKKTKKVKGTIISQ